MVLHAVAREFRGRGLAKYLWSAACHHFFDVFGFEVLESSISAANLPVLNLYTSLGFRFRNCCDVYHLHVPGSAQ
jgi:ribosomal protein S18 acetylase RimI-like enzyme